MTKTEDVRTLRCGKCLKHKNTAAFRRSTTIKRGYQAYCKDCQLEVHTEWRSKNRSHVNEKSREYQTKKREFIQKLKDKPCVECGLLWPPYLMHFDHMGDKEFILGGGQGASHSRERILAEIEKCEVRCALCHAEKTYGTPLACNIRGGGI